MKSSKTLFFVLVTLVGLSLNSGLQASTITFDTESGMNAFMELDKLSGDTGTEWDAGPSAGFTDGSASFNMYYSSNSLGLRDDSQSIFSFDYFENTPEGSTRKLWTWNFYDSARVLLGTLDFKNTGNSAVQSLDLIALGFIGVNTIQLIHPDGWMNLDNLEYGTTALSSVPLPTAFWLFGSALLGFVSIASRRTPG